MPHHTFLAYKQHAMYNRTKTFIELKIDCFANAAYLCRLSFCHKIELNWSDMIVFMKSSSHLKLFQVFLNYKLIMLLTLYSNTDMASVISKI